MLNNIASMLGVGGGVATDYESISTVTVGGGGSASVTFSSIPSTYTHLQIRGINRDTNGSSTDNSTLIRLNGDTAANYSYHTVYGNGSVAAATSGTSATSMISFGTSSFGNVFSATIIDLLNYSNTNMNKTIRWFNGFDPNGSPSSINFASGNWRNTTAISSITITPALATWGQYTQFALYGIK